MNQIVAYLGTLILLINLILFVSVFRLKNRAFKIYTIYLGFIFIIQVLSEFLILRKMNNLFLSHFYFVFQFVFLTFFYLNIINVPLQRKIIKILFCLSILMLLVQYLVFEELFFQFNLFEIFITSYFLIIYSAFHLYNMLNSKKEFYYINIGILIYLFGSTVLFLLGNLMAELKSKLSILTYTFNSIIYIFYQLLVFVEIIKIKKNANN